MACSKHIMRASLFAGFLLSLVLGKEVSAAADDLRVKDAPGRTSPPLAKMPLTAVTPALGTLKGFIHLSEGIPLAGGNVYFFNEATGPFPAPEKYWRVSDQTAKLDDKGSFSVELPAGRYYVGAIQRKGDKAVIGPPSEGDIFYAGKILYEVRSSAVNNLEVIRGANSFSRKDIEKREGITAIEGSVIDVTGKPVQNAIVFAHKKQEMNDRPIFVSDRTDKNGGYRLRVAGAGTYYLRVRDIYGGGMPASGSVMGVYGGNNPKAVVVKSGEIIRGINLTEVELIKAMRKSQDDANK